MAGLPEVPGWLLCCFWLGILAVAATVQPRDRGRIAFLSLLMFLGHLIAAGLASGRSNPLLSLKGDFHSVFELGIAAVVFAVFACRRTLPDTLPLDNWRQRPVILYAATAVAASFFGFFRYLPAINFNLKAEHLLRPRLGVLAVLIPVGGLLLTLFVLHIRLAAKKKQLPLYLTDLGFAVFGIALVSLKLYPRYYLHLHHYFWAMLLVFLFRYDTWYSRLAQAMALGIFIDGVASWGVVPIWHPA